MNSFEQKILASYSSTTIMAGKDEAGRGCLAGPLVVGAVILPKDYFNPAIKDSKKLTVKQRTMLATEIMNVAISYAIETMSVTMVETLNPKQASIVGMQNAIDKLTVKPDLILTDAEKLAPSYHYQAIIDGDNLSQSIAAALILAKVTRDNLMLEYDQTYPQYDFKNNKGYGTKKHLSALQKYGITAIHRKSYRPVRDLILKNNVTDK
ncbi:ribonuclease HII [Spiroplasma poulsonii]|uniref:Ribonuclease HII n=1 Tax=Spiroplasma poulsonii TaxID=2138 RepID=A0A3S0SMV9_9MOLU|nr:ribonuclease HII [Spiroplasma poulsonii]MBW3058183.1 ribonuclease HII [Spiroplasma poulsonii]RUP78292.1 ribonuclease HII [Spiroplasma poulsonii]